MARGGRPRKPGPRQSNGRLVHRSADDKGTPELRMKRARLVGDPDGKLAASPLGVLYARGLVQADEYHAGRRYARLFARGALHLQRAPTFDKPVERPGYVWTLGGDTGAAARLAFLRARAALEAAGDLVPRAVEDLVIYEMAPWTVTRLEAIRAGLDALYRHFEEAAPVRTAAGIR
jgi:hypothetical protein